MKGELSLSGWTGTYSKYMYGLAIGWSWPPPHAFATVVAASPPPIRRQLPRYNHHPNSSLRPSFLANVCSCCAESPPHSKPTCLLLHANQLTILVSFAASNYFPNTSVALHSLAIATTTSLPHICREIMCSLQRMPSLTDPSSAADHKQDPSCFFSPSTVVFCLSLRMNVWVSFNLNPMPPPLFHISTLFPLLQNHSQEIS